MFFVTHHVVDARHRRPSVSCSWLAVVPPGGDRHVSTQGPAARVVDRHHGAAARSAIRAFRLWSVLLVRVPLSEGPFTAVLGPQPLGERGTEPEGGTGMSGQVQRPSTTAAVADAGSGVTAWRHVGRALVAATVGVLLTVTGCSAAPPRPPGAGDGDFAGRVDIGGGRRMYLECRGTGSPTVVLIAGYGNRASAWSALSPNVAPPAVLPGVSGFTRVCAYDRPGTLGESAEDPAERSRSDPVAQPRPAEDTVADLHALLRAAHVPGPYVLAAHSLGGLYARLYAAAHPDDVAGLVLVDAAHERYDAELRRLLTPAQLAVVNGGSSSLRQQYPDFELVDADRNDALLAQARVATPLRPVPLAVLTRGQAVEVRIPGFPVGELERSWRGLQDDLATLTPVARHTIAAHSGHDIPQDEPALVVEAIRQVVTGVRVPDTWYALASCCAA
jgi:pimeloyl-ACP methyl ester carboxylesterase